MTNTELLSEQIHELNETVKSLHKDVQPVIEIAPKLSEIVEAYDSVLFGKKFLVGLASVVGSLAAIGGAVLWLVDYIRGTHGGS